MSLKHNDNFNNRKRRRNKVRGKRPPHNPLLKDELDAEDPEMFLYNWNKLKPKKLDNFKYYNEEWNEETK